MDRREVDQHGAVLPYPVEASVVRVVALVHVDVVDAVARQEAEVDRKSTRLNSSHSQQSRMPSSA